MVQGSLNPNITYLDEKLCPVAWNKQFTYLYFKNMNLVGLCVRIFRSHQKSQGHEILAIGLIWANLKGDGARFFNF